MFKKVVLFFVVVVTVFLTYVGFQPSNVEIKREIKITAASEKIFPYINNSQKMNEWMPWKESDPQVSMTYSGPEEGLGSKSEWESKGQMGTGNAVIVESNLNQNVKTKLTYTKPMDMEQLAEMTLSSGDDGATVVSWSVKYHIPFVGRLFGIFVDMDKLVGSEFEKGLNKLKSIIESNSI